MKCWICVKIVRSNVYRSLGTAKTFLKHVNKITVDLLSLILLNDAILKLNHYDLNSILKPPINI